MTNTYKQVTGIIKSGKDVSLNMNGYCEFVEELHIDKEYNFVWKPGKTECFVNKCNGKKIHLDPRQVEDIKVMGS